MAGTPRSFGGVDLASIGAIGKCCEAMVPPEAQTGSELRALVSQYFLMYKARKWKTFSRESAREWGSEESPEAKGLENTRQSTFPA